MTIKTKPTPGLPGIAELLADFTPLAVYKAVRDEECSYELFLAWLAAWRAKDDKPYLDE